MGWTNFPQGVSLTTQTGIADGLLNATAITLTSNTATAAGTITVGTLSASGILATTVSASGVVVGASGSVYGGRVSLAFGGSAAAGLYTVALTSALYDSGATILAPFNCVAEIIWVTGATANITGAIRVTATSVSTGAAVATLSVGSGTTAANTVYTTIGGTVLGQGSFLHVTSAIQATANSSSLMVNLIPVA